MLDEGQVKSLVDGIVDKSKDYYRAITGIGIQVKKPPLPNYYPSYLKAVNQMRRIAPHADVDVFPELLFAHRAPNQSEEEAKYLRNTYKCTTHPVFMDYVNSVSQGLNEGNWSWEFAEESGDLLSEYVTEGVPIYGSVETFAKTMLPALKAKDANGVIAVKPRSFKTTEVNGETVVDDTALNEPMPFYYSSEQVVGFKQDEYVIIELKSKSVVKYGNTTKQIGRIFEIYDEENIWRVEQVGQFVDWAFEYEVYFEHNKGEVPVTRLMGLPSVQDDGEVYWTSPFYHVVDLLDRGLAKDVMVEVSNTRVVFPTAIIEVDDCSHKTAEGHCKGGSWFVNGDEAGICSSCNGTGSEMNLSPFKNYYKKKKKGVDATSDSTVPLQYVSPDTAGLEFVSGKANEDKADARQMLHLRTSDTNVSGREGETATVAGIDLKQHYKFVKPISDQTFNVFEFVIEQMAWQRYGDTKEVPYVNRPKSFDFRTTEDYLSDIQKAREAGLPDSVVNMLVFKFFDSMHFGSSQAAKATRLMAKADRLLTTSVEDVNVKLAQGVVEPWEVVLHDSVTHIVTGLMLEDPTILELELADQIIKVEEKAKELAANNAPSTLNIIKNLTKRNGTEG